MSLQKEKQKTEHTSWARCAKLCQRETGRMEEGVGRPRCQGHVNTRSVRHFPRSPQRGSQAWLLLFLVHRKDKITPSPAPPKQRQNTLLFAHPLLKIKHSKKILSQYLQTHPLWRLSLYFGEEIKCSALPPHRGETKGRCEGQEDPRPGGLQSTAHPATWPMGA